MKNWSIIGTWKLSLNGTAKGAELLKNHGTAGDAALTGCQDVEDNPLFSCIGYGGLPDEDGHVTLDAGYMDGTTMRFGAVADLEGYRSPSAIAKSLSEPEFNNFLVGTGAAAYAEEHHFERRNNLTPESEQKYLKENAAKKDLSAYKETHDTVCFLAKDETGNLCVCTSTSGLFLKHAGRVGDTPVVGCGFYADKEIGAAAATGVGEEIMKGALSSEVVRRMRDGESVQKAAEGAVADLTSLLKKRKGSCGNISLIAMDHEGNVGVGTNIPFPFTTAEPGQPARLFLAEPDGDHLKIREVQNPDEIRID
ncbi:N(4)-(beta-N-acetylglucosaminyl)-L-asparaginase [Erysipelotrichaceae bacterium Oil+RF-744-GAM-WT-6]|uniref:N(4)-(Beta-N-acetylglucosaminyl)-L-asparaginase n=1 Tax=Stecheria intestinalis TaxID=2606630 RepID=A0A7X2NR98_9FIRM|nr:isoaspartyl peptidase/L-asparaginase [Stecheria intestinalis]MSS57608.1 N(4)-(beta-N-acetylglucosaminyl)-L-asparaginase [Stecheria intestinalis]